MTPDEQSIREVHSTWIAAVNAGDLDRLLSLMTDDVVFPTAAGSWPAMHIRCRRWRAPDEHGWAQMLECCVAGRTQSSKGTYAHS
jgi:ketosteroid isomerase-like protein